MQLAPTLLWEYQHVTIVKLAPILLLAPAAAFYVLEALTPMMLACPPVRAVRWAFIPLGLGLLTVSRAHWAPTLLLLVLLRLLRVCRANLALLLLPLPSPRVCPVSLAPTPLLLVLLAF